LFNFFYSIRNGKRSPKNPWDSNTLEWTAPVEHLHGNWPGEIPHVYRWPYDYSKPGEESDFIPQNIPDESQNGDPMVEPKAPAVPHHTEAPPMQAQVKEVVMFAGLKRLFGFAG
jgi:heme/copper-type cytochrome/quinol oxidase subunit 1